MNAPDHDPPRPANTEAQVDYLLSVERLLAAADEARRARDRLLSVAKGAVPTSQREAPR
jgi:hypothetical protein